MSVELWVQVKCPCGRLYAYPQNGFYPICGECRWPAVPPKDFAERQEKQMGLLVVASGLEKDLAAAQSAVDRAEGMLVGAPLPVWPVSEDIKRWALERDWNPDTESWSPSETPEKA